MTSPLRQVRELVVKEWRLLARNPHGLTVMFLMPAIFLLVLSLTLKNTLVVHIELPSTGWVLEDDSAPAQQWLREWQARNGGLQLGSRDQLHRALRSRAVQAGVVLRKPWLDEAGQPRSDQIEMWLDNRVQPAAAARLRAELMLATLQARLRIAAAQAGPFAGALLDAASDEQMRSEARAPRTRYLSEIESGRPITAVQQSVPAWLVFGMFFVVIPMAGVLIQEREDGTLARLRTFGVRPGTLLASKLVAFMLLNAVQLAFMLLVGRFIVPLFGGDAVNLDVPLAPFALMMIVTSAAAVGMALAIAAWARRFDHAAALGSGLNVVLGAIAGIMVPRMLMPPALQTVSEWSPMGWALDGLQAVFLGAPDAAFLAPRVALLLAMAALGLLLAWWRLRRPNADD